MSRLASFALAVLPAGEVGCAPASVAEPCTTGFLGSTSSPPELEVIVVQADDSVATLADGGQVPLMLPPQGGRVIYVGARATNVDGCGLQLTAALRDLTTRQVRPDNRTINLVPSGAGWGASGVGTVSTAISSFSNIPACPNQWSTTDVYGHEYGLEVTITDRGGRTASASLRATPYCSEPSSAAECMCICSAGYVLGQSCP